MIKEKSLPKKKRKSSARPRAALKVPAQKLEEIKKGGLTVVGIGASAGGLEALTGVIEHLDTSANMCYVIAQHLDPKRPSLLVPLLSRHTQLSIMEVHDGIELDNEKIYIIPPNSDAQYRNGHLFLTEPSEVGPKPSIDLFFSSLAEEKGRNTIGVILSGTGTDGAHGIRAIKAAGGFTIVQEESTAKFDGMPHAAIVTGVVDLILPPASIGRELSKLSAFPKQISAGASDASEHDEYQKILKLLHAKNKCDFSEYKQTTVGRRIERRMAVNKLSSISSYFNYLQHSPREVDLLYKDILISVTGFFRDKEAWQALNDVIKHIIKHKEAGDTIRVWSPGCATGEESYSLAILFLEILGSKVNQFNFQVYGTDLDQDAINCARKGIYPVAAVADVEQKLLRKYFTRKDNDFQVNTVVREKVIFARHDVTCDPPFLHLDLISCRNLLIYFQTELQRRVFNTFYYALEPGGSLFLGKHEAVGGLSDNFNLRDRKHKIFQSRPGKRKSQLEVSQQIHDTVTRAAIRSIAVKKEKPLEELANLAMIECYNPAGVVVDHSGNIRFIRGDVGRFVHLKQGKTNLNLVNMVHPQLRVDVRILLNQLSKDNGPAERDHIKMSGTDVNEQFTVRLRGRPCRTEPASEVLYLILFEMIEAPRSVAPTGDSNDPRISELEAELDSARERLQVTVEELETSNEELQSVNEEMQSSNEELQSTNEELETSNEELQATNEELITVNEEFQIKSAELALLNADLENVLKAVDVPMLVLDSAMKIMRHTAQAATIFDLEGEKGLLILNVESSIVLPNLKANITEVLLKGKIIEKQVGGGNQYYWMVMRPYFSEHNRIVGCILTFTDITELRRLKANLRLAEAKLDLVLESENRGLAWMSLEGKLMRANAPFCQIVGAPESEIHNRLIPALLGFDNDRKAVSMLRKVLSNEIPLYQVKRQFKNLKSHEQDIIQTISLVSHEDGKPAGGLVVVEENGITESKKTKVVSK